MEAKYFISIKEDGTGLLTMSGINPVPWDIDPEGIDSTPFIYEVGMRVLTVFGNIVTIKHIKKRRTFSPGCTSSWAIEVEENNTIYLASELLGIYIREIPQYELEAFIKGL